MKEKSKVKQQQQRPTTTMTTTIPRRVVRGETDCQYNGTHAHFHSQLKNLTLYVVVGHINTYITALGATPSVSTLWIEIRMLETTVFSKFMILNQVSHFQVALYLTKDRLAPPTYDTEGRRRCTIMTQLRWVHEGLRMRMIQRSFLRVFFRPS